jgi:hypothetical protein
MESLAYDRVMKLVDERFPLRQDWWSTVAFPAFETNWTTIWGQAHWTLSKTNSIL